MVRALIAIVALVGCGGRPWPTHAVSATDPAIAQATTVHILPLDVAVWTGPGVATSGEAIRGQLEQRVLNVALATLAQRSYGINATIDWNGQSSGVDVMPRQALAATIGALAHYGENGAAPQLPEKLGATTGADATLYVGGWALVAPPQESEASKVAGEVATALVVVAAVALVAVV